MFDWLMAGDPMSLKRAELAGEFVGFLVIFLAFYTFGFKLVERLLGKDRALALARHNLFPDYQTMYWQLQRQTTFISCLFLTLVFMLWFYVNLADVKNTFQCASLGDWMQRYTELHNPALAGSFYNASLLNISIPINRSLNFSSGIVIPIPSGEGSSQEINKTNS